jgi:hypothetical protein
MLKNKYFWLATVLIAALLFGAVGCTATELQAMQGTLDIVDSVSGTVTVTLKDGSTQTFNFDDVTIDTLKEALGNSTLEIGDQVIIRTNKHGDIEEVRVRYAVAEGVVTEIGDDNFTLVTDKNVNLTLNVTSDTLIRIEDNQTGVFSDLQVDQNVEAKYDVNTLNALRIIINPEEQAGFIQGTIQSLDDGDNTITIRTVKGGEITLYVTSDTVITVNNKGTGIFTDLQEDQDVKVHYDIDSLVASKIKVEPVGPPGQNKDKNQGPKNKDKDIKPFAPLNSVAFGVINEVGEDSLTLTNLKKGDLTLNTTADTQIKIPDNKIAALSDLEVGQRVVVKYDNKTKNALVIHLVAGQPAGNNVPFDQEDGQNQVFQNDGKPFNGMPNGNNGNHNGQNNKKAGQNTDTEENDGEND